MSEEDNYPIMGTLLFKLPFLILGIAIGMAVVWVGLQWVPAVAAPILRAAGAQ
jgi:hypothetical protein